MLPKHNDTEDGYLPPSIYDIDDGLPAVRGLADLLEKELPLPRSGTILGRPSSELQMAALAEACTAVARLDERLQTVSPAVRAGWRARAITQEAINAVRLEGWVLDEVELLRLLMDADSFTEGGNRLDEAAVAASRAHEILCWVSGRSPKQMFTPQRLLSLFRLPRSWRRSNTSSPWPQLNNWFAHQAEAWGALTHALTPGLVTEWRGAPPLIGAARLLAHWRRCGADQALGPVTGLALASAWVARFGLTHGLVIFPATGYRHTPLGWNPEATNWELHFLQMVQAAAAVGHQQLLRLDQTYVQLTQALRGRRSNCRGGLVAEWLVRSTAITSRQLAEQIGCSGKDARRMLDQAQQTSPAVREITGRGSYRVWAVLF